MAEATEEIPQIVEEPEKPLNTWKGTLKLCAMVVLGCAMYGYLYVSIRTFLIKSKMLEQIAVMATTTEQMLQNLFALDEILAADLEDLNDYYLDY